VHAAYIVTASKQVSGYQFVGAVRIPKTAHLASTAAATNPTVQAPKTMTRSARPIERPAPFRTRPTAAGLDPSWGRPTGTWCESVDE
jgi:hypothetical protein